MEKTVRPWKNDVIVALLLTGFAFWVNSGIQIKGLYMDDLYLWSCYGEQSFFEYVFPIGSTRFRFLYYLAAWLQMAVVGNRVAWFVPINILLNAGLAFTLYRMARSMSRSTYVSAVCAAAFLGSRMAYYQIGQVYGLMETMALWMAIAILYWLYQYATGEKQEKKRQFYYACVCYFAICFVHERYMALLPLLFLVPAAKRTKDSKVYGAAAVSFLLVQVIRFFTIGGLVPAGTGGTEVTDTFSVPTAIRYAFSQVAYVFGINAGPEHLNGQNFRDTPVGVLILIGIADLMLILMVLAFVLMMIRRGKQSLSHVGVLLLFVGFIGACIASSSVTIRVEMRWVYVSYAAALLFLSWMYGVLTEGMVEKGRWVQALPYLAFLSLYVVLMLPVEGYYRNLYKNLYLWPNQTRYNSLAEETYEKYGDGIFGKTIYIVGNQFEMSEFTADTFFKVYDRERKAEGTTVRHIEDIRDIGLVTDSMLVLREEPEFDRFQDITQAVKEMKLRGITGYYEDGWMDERAELQVMAGATGLIELEFFYPREVRADQWITVTLDGEPAGYLMFEENNLKTTLEVKPYQTVRIGVSANFFVPDATEQRGSDRLAVLLNVVAD